MTLYKEKLIAELETREDYISMSESLKEFGKIQFRRYHCRKVNKHMSHNMRRNWFQSLEWVGKTRLELQRQRKGILSLGCTLAHLRKFSKLIMFRLHPRAIKSILVIEGSLYIAFCTDFPDDSSCIEMVIIHWSRKKTSNIFAFPGKYRGVTIQSSVVTFTLSLYLMLAAG